MESAVDLAPDVRNHPAINRTMTAISSHQNLSELRQKPLKTRFRQIFNKLKDEKIKILLCLSY